MTHINQTAFGLALGILWGAGLFLMALAAAFWGYGVELVDFMGNVYLGTAATPVGAFIGLLWGFADGFVCGWLLAWLYNQLS